MDNEAKVIISQADYDRLQHLAGQHVATIEPEVPVVYGHDSAIQEPNTTTSEKVWFILAVLVILSFLFPIGIFFFAPIALLAVVFGAGFFKDNSSRSSTAKGWILALKIISVLATLFVVGIGVLITLIFIALSSSDAHMD